MPRTSTVWPLLTAVLAYAAAGISPISAAELTGADGARALSKLIDGHVQARLDSEGVPRAAQADDAEFLRRVFLDVHGVVPSAERAARFLASTAVDKRRELIDELLASPRYGQNFGDIWRRRLVSTLAFEEGLRPERFADWLAGRFNDNDGWDRIAFDLLTARGTIDDNPAVTYLIEGRHPRGVTDLTDLTSRYFLGIRLNCAQCHDHPFSEWTRPDYWGMAAFFAQIQTPGRPKKVHQVGVQDNPQVALSSLAEADMIDGFLPRPPTFLGGSEGRKSAEPYHRHALARWITSRENPYFARAAVNRTWWHFFGRGLVDPVDDMHGGASQSHAELLDLLSERFVESGFDLKYLCRAIVNSRTYQQTSRRGEQPDREAELFARMSIKVLSAEQLYDSLVELLGPPARMRGIDPRLGPRQEFAQFVADDGDADPTRYERGIPHLLRLMNSPQFAGRNVSVLVARLAARDRTADDVAEELFLAVLSRRPTADERELVRDHLRRAGGASENAYRELAWALFASSEFSLNR